MSIANRQNSETLLELSEVIYKISQSKSPFILTAGNGGSATTADHFAADLSLSKKRGGKVITAICLNSHLGLSTALSNDITYEEALSCQLENYLDAVSLLVVFSASGNSKNIVKLLEVATQHEIPSWAMLGFNGGIVSSMADVNKILFPDPNRNYGLIENVHLSACHYVVDELMRKMVD